MKRRLLGAIVVATLCWSTNVFAGGYDTPMLYSARHVGMGGTAIASVSDGSALFLNPAGMARVGRGNLLLDFTPLLGWISTPVWRDPGSGPQEEESELTFAPFFLAGGIGRITDWMVAGIAVYPVASSGGAYIYDRFGSTIEDATSLFFLEIAPGIAFNIPGRVTVGMSYRITYVSLDRTQGPEGGDPTLQLELGGASFAGFRFGVQWEAIEDHLSMGLTYRTRTETEVDNDEGIAFGQTITDVSSKFVLPSRIGFGLRGDIIGLGLGFDFEYAWQSQNEVSSIIGTQNLGTEEDPVYQEAQFDNIFMWHNTITLRFGAEYRVPLGDAGHLPIRAGYIWDGPAPNAEYPTAFGAPPGPTHVATFGIGFDRGPWQINLAYAYRRSSGEVTEEDINDPDRLTCVFCSHPGDYDLTMHALAIDFSYDWL